MKNRIVLFCLLITFFSGLWASEKQTGAMNLEDAKPAVKTGWAFIEMGINLAVTAVFYWIKYTQFLEDWQFTLTWKDQQRKFFTSEGLRMDSNRLLTNVVHAWAGAFYYSCARTNGLSPFVSLLFSAGGSLIWEYVAEWREISSINDHIFTIAGGPASGEPLFQIASHFRSRPGLANRIACLLVNPVLGINDFIDGKSRPARVPSRGASDFRLSLGGKQGPASPADNASAHAAFDLDLRLVTLPGYGRPGSGSGYSRLPLDNEYRISFSFNDSLVEEISARTSCVLAGWWWRRVSASENGALRGSESWLGWVMAWDFFLKKTVAAYDGDELGMTDPWLEREQPTRYTDKYSTIHLIGPDYNLTMYSGALTARLGLQATLDFSMIHSLAYNTYSADHDVWGVKTTLHNWGYYYSMGYSLEGRFDVRTQGLRLEAGIEYQRCASIQGLDRFQDDIRDDSRLSDTRFAYNAALSVAVPRSPFFFSFNLEGIDRSGRFHEVSVKNHELRFFYRLGVSF
ncbi:MAG: DUF3943 domain-containing protein [Candidatus Aminicenantes bacterium]|nr:DUF3943 domain-containing protein [Candidatus Aminicenantes bacterium]